MAATSASKPDFFQSIPRSFENVSITDDGIDTVQFLEAASGVVMLFDVLGSTAFLPVKTDLNGNIAKIRAKYDSDPAAFNTLQKIVLAEAVPDSSGKLDRTATQGLLWLNRGLEFTAHGVSNNLKNTKAEVSDSFVIAYGNTLKQFHNFIVKGIFSLAIKACPSREDFYKLLGSDLEEVTKRLAVWVDALQDIVLRLNVFYSKGAYGKGL
ncbi:hypothetical protein GGI07_002081 [Coemansia sp. Benny D115]|nr:hypothetical protein GGI07_002081 [Coemansia sp. Benny D115]